MPDLKTNLVRTSPLHMSIIIYPFMANNNATLFTEYVMLFILSGGNHHFPAIDWPINPLTSSFGY